MSVILRAASFAKRMHVGQFRKYSEVKVPYFTHVAAVAGRVATWASDETYVAVAYLHDVVEDTEITLEELKWSFNSDIASGVGWLTNPSKGSKAPREMRKREDREHIVPAPEHIKMIKAEDRLHNLESMGTAPDSFLGVYLDESELLFDVIGYAHPEAREKALEWIAFYRGRL